MYIRTLPLSLTLVLIGLVALSGFAQPASADWLYDNWEQGSLPEADWGTTDDSSDTPLTGRDIRAFAQFILPGYIEDTFWNVYPAIYVVTDRGEGFQAFRMDLKGTPTATGGNYADWYVIGIDGVPGQGTFIGGFDGIDRLIVSPWTGSAVGTPLLLKWTGTGFDDGTPFTAIPGADWQYGYWSTSNPPPPPPSMNPGYGYTLEWKLPIGELGTGPFTIIGATAGGTLEQFSIYDITDGILLGAGSIIPEPSSVVLLGLGALGFVGYLIRRRKA